MMAVVQRVSSASVEILAESKEQSEGGVGPVQAIGEGLMILLGVGEGDAETDAKWLAGKCAALRIFKDDAGKMNRSVKEIRGEALVVSQFTLLGDCRKGNRPSFIRAAKPEIACPLYEKFCGFMRDEGVPVKTGVFAAMMRVNIVNEGPVTLLVHTPEKG